MELPKPKSKNWMDAPIDIKELAKMEAELFMKVYILAIKEHNSINADIEARKAVNKFRNFLKEEGYID